MNDLGAFEAVDFQWVQTIDSVWQSLRYDVPALHKKARADVLGKLASMAASQETGSQLGWVFVGAAGSGKTHLLSAVRQESIAVPAIFVFVDMSDVHDFWETVLLGFIESLQKPAGATELTQGQLVLGHIVGQVYGDDGAAFAGELASLHPPRLILKMDDLVQRLGRTHRAQMLKHADALRALILLHSDDLELSNLGHAWLQGQGVDEEQMAMYGFAIREKKPRALVEGLSWLVSLRSPMVIAVDQLDPIVAEHHQLAAANDLPEELTARQFVSRGIIDSVGRGLMELRDVTRRSLTIVTSLLESWRILEKTVLQSIIDRFEAPRRLEALTSAQMAEQVVRRRLDAGYQRIGFTPPHATWPFAPSAFASIGGAALSPRELLKLCEEHRRACVEEGRVRELSTFLGSDSIDRQHVSHEREFEALDKELARLRATRTIPPNLLQEAGEDDLGKLLLDGCRLVVAEHEPPPSVDVTIDAESGGKSSYVALHARVRQILTNEQGRERHLCLRALTKNHPIAFQARLTAAVTASGIDRQLAFRKLVLVRNTPAPGGAKTTSLMTKARSAGAELVPASEDDVRALTALVALREVQGDKRATFEQWLRARRPASQLAVMKPIADWLASSSPVASARAALAPTTVVPVPGAKVESLQPAPITPAKVEPPPQPVPVSPPAVAARPVVAVGHQVVVDRLAGPQTLLAEDLKQHVVVLAGAGSGKTVLLRRLIEETALLGIPSIVVDGANDLARLGEPWPERPVSFTDEDAAKAARYHADTDVIVWTPGRANGNPLHLGSLPDFAAVAHDADDLTQAVAMTVDTLAGMTGKKVDGTARAILDAALRYLARQGGGDLGAFLDILGDLPAEASAGIKTAAKVATGLSDSLRAAVQINPLLRQHGEPLDPGILFGLGAARTRVSVLSLVGLQGGEAPLQFVNQLAMTLFTWVKKNPCPSDRPLRGLLILDEAKDFVPSQGSTPCKQSLIRLAAQGRKYGLGVVFATQAPKSIDHNVIANASTQFYGKASSSAALETVEEQLRARGGAKSDVARLPSGRFYLAGKGMKEPVKIAVPLCLSHHPASPPDEMDVIRRATASRARLG